MTHTLVVVGSSLRACGFGVYRLGALVGRTLAAAVRRYAAEGCAIGGLGLVTVGIAEYSTGAALITCGGVIFIFAVWGRRIR